MLRQEKVTILWLWLSVTCQYFFVWTVYLSPKPNLTSSLLNLSTVINTYLGMLGCKCSILWNPEVFTGWLLSNDSQHHSQLGLQFQAWRESSQECTGQHIYLQLYIVLSSISLWCFSTHQSLMNSKNSVKFFIGPSKLWARFQNCCTSIQQFHPRHWMKWLSLQRSTWCQLWGADLYENPALDHPLSTHPPRLCFASSSQHTRINLSLQRLGKPPPNFRIYSDFDRFRVMKHQLPLVYTMLSTKKFYFLANSW